MQNDGAVLNLFRDNVWIRGKIKDARFAVEAACEGLNL